jgi:uncharacterized membrane protein YadS
VSNLSGQVATLVKLVRVLFLGPMIIVRGLLHRDSSDEAPHQTLWEQVKLYIPWFVAGFLLLAELRSLDIVGTDLGDDAKTWSKFLFVIAMVGLGLGHGVDLKKVGTLGTKVAVTVLAAISFMIVVGTVETFVLDLKG